MKTSTGILDVLSVARTASGSLHLVFSDATQGELDASWLAGKSGSLLLPLRDPSYFGRAFVEAGGLCWPHGLSLSATALQVWLRDHGRLHSSPRAA